MSFYTELMKELLADAKNNFSHRDNYDHIRFGKIGEDIASVTFRGMVRNRLVKALESRGYSVALKERGFEESVAENLSMIDPYLSGLEDFYDLLADDGSKRLLIQIMAFRILGFTKVKLPVNTPAFWNGIKEIEALADESKYLESKFMNWHLPFIDLNRKGVPVQMYFLPVGAYTDFFLKQYEYSNGAGKIKAEKGDYVVDAGGCWGDTALYFAGEVGQSGKVFTYEFIPSNLSILETNLSLNPDLERRVNLIRRPVWETTDETMYYVDNGPGSRVFMKEEEAYDGKVSSLSIDDLVAGHSLPRIDFIKMDIEGAEPYALRGAVKTLTRFRPKLAIAIYHSLSDLVNIPKFIHGLGLGYEFHLAHCSIHEEETILFAQTSAK